MQACSALWKSSLSLQPKLLINNLRCVGTFARISGKDLWKSTSPENKRTGRGKRARVRKKEDFSGDKEFGEGNAGILWPGLNIIHTEKPRIRNEDEQARYVENKNLRLEARKIRKDTSTRGWTGAHWGGVNLGSPPPMNGQNFDDFNCIVMNVARVSHMTMRMGRVYSQRATVAVGNGKGVVGVGGCVASDMPGALRQARKKALNRLRFVERWEDRTVFEDIYVNHHRTWLSIRKQPAGYGLRCHRALTDMCKLIGIKDLYIKAFGSTTMLNLLKCFLKGMSLQETYQQKADRLGYHLVEYDELNHNYPVVLASPSNGVVNSQPHDDYNEYLNQELIITDARKDKRSSSLFHKARATNNRGIPVPASPAVPDFLTQIRDLQVS